jgi:hypothetical protein
VSAALDKVLAEFQLSAATGEDDYPGMALLASDERALRLLAAFRSVPLPAWQRPKTPRPSDLASLWMWLWSGYVGGPGSPSFLPELAALAGLDDVQASQAWPVVVASRLARPDGTVTREASMLLRAHVARSMPRPSAAPRTPTQPRQPKGGK